jgi:glycosyltransferase involved in cell wall biosynthesis
VPGSAQDLIVAQVTAVITTYNRATYLPEALRSALDQQGVDLEVIVVDDGSTDETPQVIQPFLEQITYIRQANAGRAAARNEAIRRARGTYVAFLDDDDVWLPGKLARQVAFMNANPAVGLSHGHSEMIDEQGRLLEAETARQRIAFEEAHRVPPTYVSYARRCLCLTSATIVRRQVFHSVGLYDESSALTHHSVTGEDLDLYLRIALDFELAFLGGAPLMRYRVHGTQTPLDELTLGEIAVSRKHLALLARRSREYDAERLALWLRTVDCYHRLADGPRTRLAVREAIAVDKRLIISIWILKRFALSFVPGGVLRRIRDVKRSFFGPAPLKS